MRHPSSPFTVPDNAQADSGNTKLERQGAFGERAAQVAAGEALIFHPNGAGDPTLVARLKIEEWPELARSP
jgi:hypothetical protein